MDPITPTAVEGWAKQLLVFCDKELTAAERIDQYKYATLVQSPTDKAFMSRLLDESAQIHDMRKLAERLKVLIDEYGIPKFFNTSDRLLLKVYQWAGYKIDFMSVPLFRRRLKSDTFSVIIDESRPRLTQHLAERQKHHIGQDINLLGDVVAGDEEADRRFRHYISILSEPDINYISVKLSGIYARLQPLSYDQSLIDLTERLSEIYRAAIANPYIDEDGVSRTKFVNIDIEEYKDAQLTYDVFFATLSKEEFKNYKAGISIQAYLPDAEHFLTDLLDFAHRRIADGGSPLKVRLVKGANQEMETVTSSIKGWENPVRSTKVETDAAFLHLIDIALRPKNIKALRVGIASHNLFSISYAYLTAQQNEVLRHVSFEMLEGMANNMWRALAGYGARIILYTPVVNEQYFFNAVSYLMRRLNENTGPENFLSYSFNLKPEGKEWLYLYHQFEQAIALKDNVESTPHRKQDRRLPYQSTPYDGEFHNEPTTNFELSANREWAKSIIAKWKIPTRQIIDVQVGTESFPTENRHVYKDRVQQEVVSYEMGLATAEQIERILQIATEDHGNWSNRPLDERHEILRRAADNIASRRGDLIGAMCAVTSKTINEGDAEVSEAIDLVRFYPHSMREFASIPDITCSAQGVVLVVTPWNFPLSIGVGGIAAALCGGNRVVVKPSPLAAPILWEAARAFWDAGVPKQTLQIVLPDSLEAMESMTASPRINHIALTSSTLTAQRIATAHLRTRMSAETSGKNAIILTSHGDRDKAIFSAVNSAFLNAGQKCSACSLLLVEGEVFDDPTFAAKLRDATLSIQVGSPWDLTTVVGPMVNANNEKLLQSISCRANAEKWLVAPKFLDDDRYIMQPAVLWGVEPNDFEFITELFAPLLAVVRFDGIEEAIDLVNSLDYGLTSGLQSLDERQIAWWKNRVMAGNIYINRSITGSIVARQPFGGTKLSSFGGGAKTGGPNYVTRFVNFSCNSTTDDYAQVMREQFATPTDRSNLYGEQNILRYIPLPSVVLRVTPNDSIESIDMVARASIAAGTPLTISIEHFDPRAEDLSMLGCDIVEQNTWEFIASLKDFERIRTLSTDITEEIYRAAAGLNKYIDSSPAIARGRVELLHFVREQSISYEYHRYGSITEIPLIK